MAVRTWIQCGICHRMQEDGMAGSWRCAVCRRTFCGSCRSVVAGNYEPPHLCVRCGERKDVQRIVRRASVQIDLVETARHDALAALPRRAAVKAVS